MNSDLQRQALNLLAEVWALSPDVRLGQLVAHLGFLGEIHLGRSLGYIDDDELMSIMDRHRAELLARLENTPNQTIQPTGVVTPGIADPKPAEATPAAELSC
jgi:hypothetical protein